jgi:sec-independent protein translocase protein TatA
MPNVGPLELIVVLIIALIVFGPKRLPELGRSLGKGIREFRGSVSGDRDDDDDDDSDSERPELPQSKAQAQTDTVESVEGEVVADKRG